MMGGTLLLLGRAGCELHYMTVANGSCGTACLDSDEIVAIRRAESAKAAALFGATCHQPLVDDIMIYNTPELAARLGAVVRRVDPQIVLVPSGQDYMEDHTNTSRLMVTATFCRAMRNFQTDPPRPPVRSDVALYHALPWGLSDQLRRPIQPDFFVDISAVLDRKLAALACHQSQKLWLDESQGLDSYLTSAEQMSARVGEMSGGFEHAEGWQRHNHLGFGPEDYDPLREMLRDGATSSNTGENQ